MQTLFVHMKLLANPFFIMHISKKNCVQKFIVYTQYSRKFIQKQCCGLSATLD